MEIQQKAAMSVGETEELKSVLVRTQQEVEGLKAERELMVTSHQNRIEQLRESFKQKLAESEKWPSKLHESIQKERDKCSTQKQELERKLKESFTMELDIEKQKHQQLLDKYKSDYESQLTQLRTEIRTQNSKHRSEISILEKQITEAKQHGNSNEASLRQEIQSLKNIIAGLEERLVSAGNQSDDLVTSLRDELREAEQDLSNVKQETKELEEKLESSREEITFLQETVRRECEERYELTEALSEAREQLLTLQRPAVGYNSPRPSSASKTFVKSESSVLNRMTSHSNVTGQTAAANRATNSPVLGSPSGKMSGQNQGVKFSEQNRGSPSGKLMASSQGNINRIGSNSINVGFEGVGMPPTKPAQGKPKEGSVDDSRQRIAAAVRRK
ncbi:uncharacterized protein [Ptychodera flava]|uniref:uncharacterized protein n=1 Tax=Ptychodera flava TaxID=63121 RepID=UPI00396A3FE2